MQAGEGELHLGLHAGCAHHPELRRLLDEVLEQRRLADTRLTTDHQCPAFARADGLDQPVEHVAFAATARQRSRAAADWDKVGHLAGESGYTGADWLE